MVTQQIWKVYSKQISQTQMISCLYLTYVCFTVIFQIIALYAVDIALVLVIRMLNSGNKMITIIGTFVI